MKFNIKPNYSAKQYQKARLHYTREFIGSPHAPILDIGEKNPFFDSVLSDRTHTYGDLNGFWWGPPDALNKTYRTILCFHVIEHLLNPLLFMERMKGWCNSDTSIFITYPSGHWWHEIHWHQIDRKRFLVLIDMAGFEVVRYRRVFMWKAWKYIFFKPRPFLRWVVFGQREEQYELRIKQ